MKVSLYVLFFACIFFVGCAFSGAQRFKDIPVGEASTVAVLCEYEKLCESNEYGNFKEGVERTFASRGFRVVPFKALDEALDYLIVVYIQDKYNGDYVKVALLDYRSREIVGRMSYSPFANITKATIYELVEEMLDSPVVEPDSEMKLK